MVDQIAVVAKDLNTGIGDSDCDLRQDAHDDLSAKFNFHVIFSGRRPRLFSTYSLSCKYKWRTVEPLK
jgi:hypothetical protein